MATLLLLTEAYPLGGVTEQAFIEPEIGLLCRSFDRVIIAPVMERGAQLPLPPNAEVSRALLHPPTLPDRVCALLHPTVWRHLWHDRSYIHSARKLLAALSFSTRVLHYQRLIRRMNLPEDTVCYTFWFEYQAAAVARLKLPLVSRAHGHDVYDAQYPFLSHSWRLDTLRHARGVYAASDAARVYIQTDYPDYAAKVHTAPLGSPDPVGSNPDSDTDTVNLLTVSRLVPVKGVLRAAECIKALAEKIPEQKFHWTVIGDGPQMPELREKTASLPSNLTVQLLGAMPNADIHRYMADNHVDFLVQLSLSEGGRPIAICEAMSYGVPVIASAVGGVPEVVDDSVGVLLSPHPTPAEFAARVSASLPRRHTLRTAARTRWATSLRASTLRAEFVQMSFSTPTKNGSSEQSHGK